MYSQPWRLRLSPIATPCVPPSPRSGAGFRDPLLISFNSFSASKEALLLRVSYKKAGPSWLWERSQLLLLWESRWHVIKNFWRDICGKENDTSIRQTDRQTAKTGGLPKRLETVVMSATLTSALWDLEPKAPMCLDLYMQTRWGNVACCKLWTWKGNLSLRVDEQSSGRAFDFNPHDLAYRSMTQLDYCLGAGKFFPDPPWALQGSAVNCWFWWWLYDPGWLYPHLMASPHWLVFPTQAWSSDTFNNSTWIVLLVCLGVPNSARRCAPV